jgi:rhodanese-related sulfurtransferase
MNWKKVFIQAVAIAVFSALMGVTFNHLRAEGIPLVPKDKTKEAAECCAAETGPVDLAGAKKLYDSGAVFLDARSKEDFERGHIKGALNFHYAEIKDHSHEILEKIDLEKTIVTYCSGEDCHSSDIAAGALLDMGYERVRVFFGGWPAWKGAGYPIEEKKPEQTPIYKSMGVK